MPNWMHILMSIEDGMTIKEVADSSGKVYSEVHSTLTDFALRSIVIIKTVGASKGVFLTQRGEEMIDHIKGLQGLI